MVVLAILAALFLALLVYVFVGGPKLPAYTDAEMDAALQSDLAHVVSGDTGFATSNGSTIWFERRPSEGPSRGVVILNMSMAADALQWPRSLLRALTEAGFEVVRYDYRGTGMSDWMAGWDRKHPYTLRDMANDAFAVLDALGVRRAHVLGVSMGGMVAQEMAIAQPDRVASLTLISTSGDATDPTMPGLSTGYLLGSLLRGIPSFKYRLLGGERNRIKERIAQTMRGHGPDGLDLRELAERVLYDLRERRGINLRAMLQHQAAVSASGSRYKALRALSVPTLVIHGTTDRLLPLAHGEKLQHLIPNAQSLWLEGVGHVVPYPHTKTVERRILAHLVGATGGGQSPGSTP